MNQTNLDRLTTLRARGIAAALLSNPWTIAWLTGYAPPIQTGPSPFEGGPALAWWCRGELTLIASDAEAGAAARHGQRRCASTRATRSTSRWMWSSGRPRACVRCSAAGTAAARRWQSSCASCRAAAGGHRARGAARRDAAAGGRPVGAAARGQDPRRDRQAARGAGAVRPVPGRGADADLQPGVSEIALWGELKAGLEVQAGGRLPVLADLVAGVRTGDMGGLPGAYVLQEGDPVIADIVPRLDGYWGDICGTHFVGAPSAEMAKIRGIVHDALRRGDRRGATGRDRAGPGRHAARARSARPATSPTRTTPATGWGSATTRSRASCRTTTWRWRRAWSSRIEPGIYLPGVGGVRLENVVLVTQDGCEVLTKHLGH